MDRRGFLKSAVVVGAGLAVVPGAAGEVLAADGPVVVTAKGQDAAKLVRAAVAALGGIGAFIKKGDVVVVKPNIGWDRTPEQAANTNPAVVVEMVRICLDAGASKVKVFDRTCNDARRCYTNSGIGPAVEAIRDSRVELSHIDDRKFKMTAVPGGRFMKEWPIYEDILTADKIINVPVAKHHGLAGLTLGMKNLMGVMGAKRADIHKGIDDALVDLNTVVRPVLTLVDATRILTANGPQGGRLEDVKVLNTVVAGRDIVAVDTVAASLFGKTPKEISHIKSAHERGLGVADMGRIRLKKINV